MMLIKTIILTTLVILFSLLLVPIYVVVMTSQKWIWKEIKKIYKILNGF